MSYPSISADPGVVYVHNGDFKLSATGGRFLLSDNTELTAGASVPIEDIINIGGNTITGNTLHITDSATSLLTSGDVAIGSNTTAQGTRLNVTGNTLVSNALVVTGHTAHSAAIQVSAVGAKNCIEVKHSTVPGIGFADSTNEDTRWVAYQQNADSGMFKFQSQPLVDLGLTSTVLSLTHNGEVGIMNTTPTANLSVTGNVYTSGDITTDGIIKLRPVENANRSQVWFYDTDDADNKWILDNLASGSDYNYFQIFRGGAGPPAFRISADRDDSDLENFMIINSTMTPYNPLAIVQKDSDLSAFEPDATDSAHLTHYALSLARHEGATLQQMGIAFSLAATSTVSDQTPGAAITHERLGGFSQGKLHFKTKGTDTQAADCVTRMTIDETGKVGVGTTSPTEALDVVGNVKASGDITTDGVLKLRPVENTDRAQVWFYDTDDADNKWVLDNRASSSDENIFQIFRGGAGPAAIQIKSDTNDSTLQNFTIINAFTSLPPYNPLAVVQNDSVDPTEPDAADGALLKHYVLSLARHGGNAGQEMGLAFSQAGDGGATVADQTPGAAITHERVGSFSQGKLHFKTKGTGSDPQTDDCTTRMTIDETGKVGVGTITPTEALDVVGNIKASGDINTSGYVNLNSSTNNGIYFRAAPDTDFDFLIENRNGSGVDADRLVFANGITTDEVNWQPAMVIIKDTGNVGIGRGVYQASEALDVVGNIKASGYVEASSMRLEGLTESYNAYIDFAVPANSSTGDFDGRLIFNQNSTSTVADQDLRIVLSTDGAGNAPTNPNMKFTRDGKVGINTASPAQALDVAGSIQASGAIHFGTTTRQMVNLWSTGYGIGVQSSTSYFRTGGNFAWYLGGSHDDNALSAGFGGTIQMVIANGNLGVGKTNPLARLEVSAGSINTDPAGTTPATYFTSATTNGNLSHDTDAVFNSVSIFADDDILSKTNIAAFNGVMNASDERIKSNIQDISDTLALDQLRLLQPKTYNYKDTVKRGEELVIGFIAQEVKEVIPTAVQKRRAEIPNIYEMANVSQSNVITFTNFNTSNLNANSTVINIRTITNGDERVTLANVVDEHTIQVVEDLSDFIGSVDEDGNVITQTDITTYTQEEYDALEGEEKNAVDITYTPEITREEYNDLTDEEKEAYTPSYSKTETTRVGDGLFVYGQEVDDFNFLKKEAVFTVATAALQEVDRQQQADKAEIATLKSQVADLLARVQALENP